LKDTFAEWSDDEVPRLAAALAYYAVFSVAPILVIVIAVAGFF
jgi:membrane protein